MLIKTETMVKTEILIIKPAITAAPGITARIEASTTAGGEDQLITIRKTECN
ncbi:MAG: hypothetical protein JWP45_612 [Mucilaginibacter sp.]|jgi:hypothetical protein|nr:hypothetical protein [Mucilaginibacter sp.]MDB5138870.1 hypothetical protein [Mucilaginibacter sp.]